MGQPIFFFGAALVLLSQLNSLAGAQGVGVTFARHANNLPEPKEVINLIDSYNIHRIRLYQPDHDVLEALRHSRLQVIVGVRNDEVVRMAFQPQLAADWVKSNILPFASEVNFRCIVVGDKLAPGDRSASAITWAMKNIQKALQAANLVHIPLSTVISVNALSQTFPPSAGTFDPEGLTVLKPILDFLGTNMYPLLCEIYTYHSYQSDPNYQNIPLDYALLDSPVDAVQDGPLGYTNMFDGLVDAFHSALEKIGLRCIQIIVSETGWPSAQGTSLANHENAKTYNLNLVLRLKGNKGTPKWPNWPVETYVHTLFNQDQEQGFRKNFGLFYADKKEIYSIFSVFGN